MRDIRGGNNRDNDKNTNKSDHGEERTVGEMGSRSGTIQALTRQIDELQDLDIQTERIRKANKDMEKKIKQMTEKYGNRITECGQIVR